MAKRSPLFSVYKDYPGVKLVDFAGWELPLNFQAGIIAEHLSVRQNAGLFDVSHMGEIEIEGPDAGAFVDWLVTNDVGSLAVGQAAYSPMCYSEGGVVDDLLVYRLGEQRFMLVVNAANTDADLHWIRDENPWIRRDDSQPPALTITNRSDTIALMAFQGPKAAGYLRELLDLDVDSIPAFQFVEGVDLIGRDVLLSRTGYTGEDGFEIYTDAKDAGAVWTEILTRFGPSGVLPCGLGARDTLRIEAKLPLYGQEISRDISPLEGGLKPFVKLDKKDFCGKQALLAMKERGVPRVLRGFRMIDKGVPRHGYRVLVGGEEVGEVTSGLKSPMLDSFVGLALVRAGTLHKGMEIEIDFGGRRKHAEVIGTPFYRREGGKK